MIDVIRTTIIAAITDLIGLSAVLFLFSDVSTVRVVVGYFGVKLVVFTVFRFSGGADVA